MPSTHKKILIRKQDRQLVRGFVEPDSLADMDPVELLDTQGQGVRIPQSEIRLAYFMREFTAQEPSWRRRSGVRPRHPGLWVRLRFQDDTVLEGVVPNNLLALSGFGLHLLPPDSSGEVQRIYVPRNALRECQVLGVIGAQRRTRTTPVTREQIQLFPASPPA